MINRSARSFAKTRPSKLVLGNCDFPQRDVIGGLIKSKLRFGPGISAREQPMQTPRESCRTFHASLDHNCRALLETSSSNLLMPLLPMFFVHSALSVSTLEQASLTSKCSAFSPQKPLVCC